MTLEELITKYTFDVDDKGLDKLNKKLETSINFAAAAGVAFVGAVATVFGFAKATAHAGDEALKASQKIGISVEALQELQFAAKLANVSSEQMTMSLRFLNRNMVEAVTGNRDANRAFGALGVRITDNTGHLLSTDKVLAQVANRFKAMPDGPRKTAAALNVFGRSGSDLIPLLNNGADGLEKFAARARELGVVIDTETAKQANEMNDSLNEMYAALTGIRNLVGARLIPVITELANKFTDWLVVNRKLIATKLNRFMDILIKFIVKAVYFMEKLFAAAQGLARVFGGLENVIYAVAAAFIFFAGAQILAAIGNITLFISKLRLVQIQMWLINAAALAIPIAIGALIVILGLMIEDIYQFFAGGDSVLGTWVEAFKFVFTELGSIVKSFFIDDLVPFITGFANTLLTILLTPVRGLMGLLRAAIGEISFGEAFANTFQTGEAGTAANKVGPKSLDQMFGISPMTASGSAGSPAIAPTVTVQNNITMGADADPEQVGRKVESGTGTALDKALRNASRAYAPAGGY